MENQIDILSEMADFVFASKYSRYNEKLGRREIWEETAERVANMHLKKFRNLPKEDKDEIKWAFDLVKEKRVVPSMRSMQFGGKAIEVANPRLYNCAVRHIDSIRSFAEIFYLLLCGCGVSFGLSKHFLNRIPDLVDKSDKTGTIVTYVIEDHIQGWADSVEALLMCYFKNTAYTGRKVVFDYSRIRPEGTPLKISGGKAPGYKGLKNCHKKIKNLLDGIIEDEHVKRLRSIHAYDILMHCSDAVLSGGIRRAATAAIFEPDDKEMMEAKIDLPVDKKSRFVFDEETNKYHGKVMVSGKSYEVELKEQEYKETLCKKNKIFWKHIHPQRARSNNSVLILRDQIDKEKFKKIIQHTKQYGEPGYVFVDHPHTLLNPCFESSMIPTTYDGICGVQFCNLVSINGAKIKSKSDFLECAKAAALIGTLQASYTDFKYLRPASKQITEEEALLGVSITGVMDHPETLLNPENQREAASVAVKTNEIWAKKININPAPRVTLLKPEGTSSICLGSASGIHPHHAKKYFRRIQVNKLENPYKYFKSLNPHCCEESQWSENKTDDVITFPIEVKNGAICKSDLTAIEHLKIIKSTQENWVLPGTTKHNKKPLTHSISCTVKVKEEEWEDVINFIYNNNKNFAAVSLLPDNGDKLYQQAPLEAVLTAEDGLKWEALVNNFKPVDYSKIAEDEDETSVFKEAACAGGSCELI